MPSTVGVANLATRAAQPRGLHTLLTHKPLRFRYRSTTFQQWYDCHRVESFRFMGVSLPGGLGNRRIDTSSVRHYLAALPPGRKLSVYERVVTGRVREPMDRYKLRAAVSGGIAARVGSFRFMGVSSPGGLGNQWIDTSSVRHYLAALPPGSETFGLWACRYRAG